MKTLLIAACLMWSALVAELAWPNQLAQGSLLLPIACSVMCWTRSTNGLMLSGLVLLMDWIARPSQLPWCPMLLPFMAVIFVAPSVHNAGYRVPGFAVRIPVPLQLPLLTLAAVLLQTLGLVPSIQILTPSQFSPAIIDQLKSLAIIALPMSAGISLLIRMADEFGMRRSIV